MPLIYIIAVQKAIIKVMPIAWQGSLTLTFALSRDEALLYIRKDRYVQVADVKISPERSSTSGHCLGNITGTPKASLNHFSVWFRGSIRAINIGYKYVYRVLVYISYIYMQVLVIYIYKSDKSIFGLPLQCKLKLKKGNLDYTLKIIKSSPS